MLLVSWGHKRKKINCGHCMPESMSRIDARINGRPHKVRKLLHQDVPLDQLCDFVLQCTTRIDALSQSKIPRNLREANRQKVDLKGVVRRAIRCREDFCTAVGARKEQNQSMLSKAYVDSALDASAYRGRSAGGRVNIFSCVRLVRAKLIPCVPAGVSKSKCIHGQLKDGARYLFFGGKANIVAVVVGKEGPFHNMGQAIEQV
jgi:hypothetical protein